MTVANVFFNLVKENKLLDLEREYFERGLKELDSVDWQLLFEEACRLGSLKIARFLYHKENYNIDLHFGNCNPLRCAISFKRYDVAIWLLNVGGLSLEDSSAYGGVEGVLRMLIEPTSYEILLKDKRCR